MATADYSRTGSDFGDFLKGLAIFLLVYELISDDAALLLEACRLIGGGS